MTRGEMINHRASLGSRIVSLKEQIPSLEKEARKTPPKTLLKEREKVAAAKVQLERLKEELPKLEEEYRQARKELGEE